MDPATKQHSPTGPDRAATGKKPPNRTPPGPGDKWEKGQELRRGGKASAPKNFGVMAGRRTLAPGDDLEGGTRVDPEGMVYALDGGGAIYFCDRFRRYRFEAGPAGLELLRGLVVRLSAMLALNAKRFSTDPTEATAQRAQGYELYEEKPTLRKGNVKRVAADGETHTVGTWSDEEYGLVGFQWIYLRFKSFQRFTETWALFERCAAAGLFGPTPGVVGGVAGPRPADPPPAPSEPAAALGGSRTDAEKEEAAAAEVASRPAYRLRIASLGGGPGFELLAAQWFLRYWAAVGGRPSQEREVWLAQGCFEAPELAAHAKAAAAAAEGATREAKADAADAADEAEKAAALEAEVEAQVAGSRPPQMTFASLDLQGSWDEYVLSLGQAFTFSQWDVHGGGAKAVLGTEAEGAHSLPTTTVCVLSNILCYCSDDATADLFASLLSPAGGVSAILVNERNAEQSIVPRLARRGVRVLKLLDQASAGRDDRQMVFLPPSWLPLGAESVGVDGSVFPNQPYEERKLAAPAAAVAPAGAIAPAADSARAPPAEARRRGAAPKLGAPPPAGVSNAFGALELGGEEEKEEAD